mmetsp:Transcript_6141/g.13508  ORF Transcript_6141/g.13508 Transcript_6141/m.13508 type:complete len:359 (+) Transcript_6141:169-1245(+)
MEETNADVLIRPPLPPDHPFPADYSALPFTTRRTLRSILCRMYVATEIMELGTESRFTSLVVFQRYYFASLHSTEANASSSSGTGTSTRNSSNSNNNSNTEKDDTQRVRRRREHLGTVAAACLFLGCKAEEEHRRIRDVINVAHMLDFSAEYGDDDDSNEAGKIASTNISVNDSAELTGTESGGASQTGTSDTTQSQSTSAQTSRICIHEASRPPELDDTYWETKEQIVSTEQEILRILRFDVSVSHPHRAVLLILDGLGIGEYDMQRLVKKAWELLNNALFYPPALRHPLLPLACGAIGLGETLINEMDGNGNKSACDGHERIKMPTTWWTDLRVTEHEIEAATLSLQYAVAALNVF